MDRGLDWRERIEIAIAQVIEDTSMEPVRSALGDEADLPPSTSSSICGVSSGIHTKFRNSFCRELQTEPGFNRLPINPACVNAIEPEVVVVDSLARKSNAGLGSRSTIDASRRKKLKGRYVSTIQWQPGNLCRLDRSSHCRVVVVQIRPGVYFDVDALIGTSDQKPSVDGSDVSRVKINICKAKIAECDFTDGQRKSTDRQGRNDKRAVTIRRDLTYSTCAILNEFNLSVGNQRIRMRRQLFR